MNESPITRVTLIARMCEIGNNDAWVEFVEIYQPMIQRFIQRHGIQYADAAEVTQEVLSRVANSINSWDELHQQSTFRGWLYRISRNQTIDFLRKKKIECARITVDECGLSQIASPIDTKSQEFHAEYEKQLFYWAAEKLKPNFKPTNWKAFWMSTVDGLSIEEVARTLNIECGTVYIARSRIMARLSILIQDRLNETSSLTYKDGDKND